MAPPRVLITFDIDGTLLQCAGPFYNLLHKRAFHYAFKMIYDKEADIDAINHHGLADPQILLATLAHFGMAPETTNLGLEEMIKHMLNFANDHLYQIKEGLELHPGVAKMLDGLSRRDDVVLGLATGSLKQIALMKLEGLGIKKFFSIPLVGAFGDDIRPSNNPNYVGELVKLAGARATELYEGGFRLRVHVGDSPQDIQGAEYGGARPIGVCSGVHSWDELLKASVSKIAKPSLFYDFTNIEGFMEACDLIGSGHNY